MRHSFLQICSLSKRFASDVHANISILFAFSAIAMLIAGGSGIDLGRAYFAKQRLIETATLACQYASRPSVTNAAAEGGASYSTMVATFINSTLQSEHFQYTQTNGMPFTYTANGPGTVTLNASVPTTFGQILKINFIPISATSHCYDTAPNSNFAVFEGFENSGCPGGCYIDYPTSIGTQIYSTAYGTTVATPNSTATSTIGYIGSGGAQWVIMGYCLEVDTVGQILSTVPEGSHSAELDCDNGSNNAGNSSISTKTYMATGNYELRYNYAGRVDYPDYDPVYLCGSQANDLSWANDTNAWDPGASNPSRTNQINVYLDANVSGVPTTHKTMDNTQSLGGTNLIDMCVYSNGWIERSVRIKITTAGYYWLSFAADGQNDSFGGQIDNIRLCYNTCAGTPNDNFPPTWLAVNNGGANKLLFEDTFESPVYIKDTGQSLPHTKYGNMNNSYGTSGSLSGWPSLAASGWATGPYNEVIYDLQSAEQGLQSVALDGWNSSGSGVTNRAISRAFLLDPGYYQVNYWYISDTQFSGTFATYCTAAPGNGTVYAQPGYTNTSNSRFVSGSYSANNNTNLIGVFLANQQLINTPIGGGAEGSTTSYTTTNGSGNTYNGSSYTTVAPDNVNWSSYTASQFNPAIDVCQYSYTWTQRTVPVKITKPGYYWLTFSASAGSGNPTNMGDGTGGSIDDVKFTALGSLYMSNPPTQYLTTIPVIDPQPGSQKTYTGFLFVADPLTAPASAQ